MHRQLRLTIGALAISAAMGAAVLHWGPATAQAAEFTMRIGSGGPAPDVRHEAVYCMREKLPQGTNGRLEVKFFEGDMGNERQIMERLIIGTIEGYVGSTGPLQSVVSEPIASIYDVPFLFADWDHLYRVANSTVGERLHTAVRAKGIHILDYLSLGTRALYTRAKPVKNPEDLRGLKLRIMENPVYVAMYKEFGALPVPMAMSEIYMALQTGVIDGVDGSLAAGMKWKHTEAVKYVTHLGNHVVIANVIAVSHRWWRALPEDIRGAISKTAKSCALVQHEKDRAQQTDMRTKWKAAGIEFTDVDREAMRKIALRVYPRVYQTIGKDLIDQVLAMETK